MTNANEYASLASELGRKSLKPVCIVEPWAKMTSNQLGNFDKALALLKSLDQMMSAAKDPGEMVSDLEPLSCSGQHL